MKASDLLAALPAPIEQYGDLPVGRADWSYGAVAVSGVKVCTPTRGLGECADDDEKLGPLFFALD